MLPAKFIHWQIEHITNSFRVAFNSWRERVIFWKTGPAPCPKCGNRPHPLGCCFLKTGSLVTSSGPDVITPQPVGFQGHPTQNPEPPLSSLLLHKNVAVGLVVLCGMVSLPRTEVDASPFCVVSAAEDVERFWDGEKVVIVAKEGATVLLPCNNWNHIWTERHDEEDQQVVHWDWQSPGVPHDRADRLIDLYASGEGRLYGPLFIRQKMNITDRAFDLGDFSLRISSLEAADEGTYSCHLHHHYCGLHERRIFRVSVVEPEPEKKVVNLTRHNAPAVGRSLQRKNGTLFRGHCFGADKMAATSQKPITVVVF